MTIDRWSIEIQQTWKDECLVFSERMDVSLYVERRCKGLRGWGGEPSDVVKAKWEREAREDCRVGKIGEISAWHMLHKRFDIDYPDLTIRPTVAKNWLPDMRGIQGNGMAVKTQSLETRMDLKASTWVVERIDPMKGQLFAFVYIDHTFATVEAIVPRDIVENIRGPMICNLRGKCAIYLTLDDARRANFDKCIPPEYRCPR